MDFTGVGFAEILFVLLVALLVFGPRRLPEIGRMLGQGMRKFKMATTELTQTLTEEVNREVREVKDELKEASEEVSSEVKGVGDSFMKDVNLDPEKPSESVGETKKESIVTSSGCEEDEVET